MFTAGISQRDIQKFILKKKVKKYVSQYLEKFSRQSHHQEQSSGLPQDEPNQFDNHPTPANEDLNEQEKSIDVDEHVDEEDTIVPNSKLGQILGINKVHRNKVNRRSVYRSY